jgi:predicted Fe-S protein YdhL (DUF1289 family)
VVSAVVSPCVGLCRLDDNDALCLGCYRTLEEIGRWSVAGQAEQRAIVAAAAGRQRSLAPAAASASFKPVEISAGDQD